MYRSPMRGYRDGSNNTGRHELKLSIHERPSLVGKEQDSVEEKLSKSYLTKNEAMSTPYTPKRQ